MNKSKIPAVAIALLLIIILLMFVKNLHSGDKALTSPTFWQKTGQSVATPDSTSSYNPPKEIKYDSSTDLKKELDSIDPKILDSDFDGI